MTKPARAKAIQSRAVQIRSRDAILRGELNIPIEARGVVLFAHGSGSSRYSPRNQFVAQTIFDAGIGTLLFDLLTVHEEAIDSITRHLRFDIGLLAGRLIDATRWLNHEYDYLNVGYFGSSTGGGAALVAAAEASAGIGAVVSRGGRPDLAGDALPLVHAPTLLIVGGLDYAVMELNREAYDSLTCEKEFKVIPGATHLFEEPGTLEEVARAASEWFSCYLNTNNGG
ncbi:MAG: hydrolase [Blastocatellia bacterium]|nr:MAG: hydrolase [Blastocatellia bacterium]